MIVDIYLNALLNSCQKTVNYHLIWKAGCKMMLLYATFMGEMPYKI